MKQIFMHTLPRFLTAMFSGKFGNQKFFSWLLLPLSLAVLASMAYPNPALATGVYEIPGLSSLATDSWVLDRSEVLSRLSEGEINTKLETLAQNTGKEVRFITIHRLDYGETIATFTQELFTKWFPTPEAQANQILLALDTVTNTTAIATGAEIKALMSKDIADSVAQETVIIPIQNGNKYNQAFLNASDRLVAVLSGEPDPGVTVVAETIKAESTFKSAEETDTKGSTIWVIALLIAATVIPMATYFFYQGFSN
jgi:uncharacterized protein